MNRLQDIHYRVHPFSDPADLVSLSSEERPLVVFADSEIVGRDVPGAIRELRKLPAIAHIPVIVFGDSFAKKAVDDFQRAGATLTVSNAAVLAHLPQLLEQALRVD
ncbi:MAG TPA: hypothetical protein PKA41_16050 [Verrucomicrobiota bacterium]|nr:hypothetical protein [Verrucomicrobiota bacterium]